MTTVVLSAVTVLPAASCTVAVRSRVVPEVRFVVEPVSATWLAAPWTTVKAPRVPVVRPEAVASIVTEPTSWPVTVLLATPLEAVAVPVPLTVPAPEAWLKLTTVVLSEVTVLPAASCTVAVSSARARGQVGGRARECDLAAAPWMTVKAPRVPVVSPEAVASVVTVPISWPVTVLVATPAAAVSRPVPLIVPVPEAWVKVTEVELSAVTVLPAASCTVAVRTRVAARGEVGGRAGEGDLAAAPWMTVKAPRVPV